MRFLLLLSLLASSLVSAAEQATASPFASLPTDPPPKQLVRGSHYWVSNEDQLDLFHDAVKDKGGLYLGVGAEQNYLMAAWAKSETLVLMDFDEAIVDLHRVYRVMFRAAEKPEDFVKLWREDSKAAVTKLIEDGYPDKTVRAQALKAYQTARWTVEQRLKRVKAEMEKAKLSCFFVDADDYAFVRRLFMEDKVFAVRGDLTMAGTVLAVGQAATQAKMKMGVLYLSNAEQYFPFTPQFRDNIKSLPLDANTVVLRTSGQRAIPHVKDTYYHYNVQTGSSFEAWVADPKIKDVREMLTYAPATGKVEGTSFLDQTPDEARAAREAQKQKAAPARSQPAPKKEEAPKPKANEAVQ